MRTYAFGLNMSGYEGKNSDFAEHLGNISTTNCPNYDDKAPNESKIDKENLNVWRDNALINTYLVTAPFQDVIVPNNWGIGIDYNQVRILNN